VDTARPWAVWVCRLASYSTFWLAQDLGRCTRVASPSTHTASPERAISARRSPSSPRPVTKVPSGWQKPRSASGPSSRSRLSPTSVLEIPTMRPARRYDSPSRMTAATASKRTSRTSGRVPPCPGRRGGFRSARRPASQVRTLAGSDERGQDAGTGPDLHGRLRDPADGLVSADVRASGHVETGLSAGAQAIPGDPHQPPRPPSPDSRGDARMAPQPSPAFSVREAATADAPTIADLAIELGYHIGVDEVRQRLAALPATPTVSPTNDRPRANVEEER